MLGSNFTRSAAGRRRFPLPAAVLVLLAGWLAAVSLSGCDRNRVTPGAAPLDAPVAAAAPAPAAGGGQAAGPQQTAEGWKFSYSAPTASSVHLAGSFNNWSTSADPLTKGTDGIWTLVKRLDPGAHQYKFVVNGSDWKEDPNNPNSADDGYGGKNSMIQVP